MTQNGPYVIAHIKSAKPTAYYAEDGMPWWAYDKETHATRYLSKATAERHAEQLRRQRARSGQITVVPYEES